MKYFLSLGLSVLVFLSGCSSCSEEQKSTAKKVAVGAAVTAAATGVAYLANKDDKNDKCKYKCYGEVGYPIKRCPNKQCKAKFNQHNHDAETKVLYESVEDAACAAEFLGKKYGNGNRIYECPDKHGYHLTTSDKNREKLLEGTIQDINGNDITQYICIISMD
jgi:hypothetical protein